MRNISKILVIGLCAILIMACPLPVMAAVPYQGYTFNHWGGLIPAPVSYTATRVITAADICPELGSFLRPNDMAVDKNNIIYVLDTGNNRIVAFDQDLNLVRIISYFDRDGITDTFNNPGGIFVCYALNIYIADTENRRVVILDSEGRFLSQIYNPDLGDIDDAVDFRPLRVAADRAGRVYVIVMHVFEGIMRFDEDGQFFGYFGTIEVRISAADIFWRRFATQAQRERQRRFIPTEFTGIDVDDYGFVFTTHWDLRSSNDQVMRLNPRGNDVLRNLNENVVINGDQRTRWYGTNSFFVDIITRPNGLYSTLDATRGRVFTYDSEGNLLYVFGGDGSVMGMNRNPVALDVIGDNIMVLDSLRGRIVYYEPTEYGALINLAAALRYQGDELGSVEVWRQVMVLNEHSEMALSGIGRAYLLEGEYELAMDYLRRGMNLRYYSLALGRRRQVFVEDNLPLVLSLGLLVAVALAVRSVYRNVKGIGRGEELYD